MEQILRIQGVGERWFSYTSDRLEECPQPYQTSGPTVEEGRFSAASRLSRARGFSPSGLFLGYGTAQGVLLAKPAVPSTTLNTRSLDSRKIRARSGGQSLGSLPVFEVATPKPRADECVRPYTCRLAAAAGATAAHAAVATAVSGHDAAAEAAAGGIAQIDDARQRVGGVDG
jgi:hypothetical protein